MALLGWLVGWLVDVHMYYMRSGQNRNAFDIHERKNCDGCKIANEDFRNTHTRAHTHTHTQHGNQLSTACVPGKTVVNWKLFPKIIL
jgi:hypothetical protein